MPWKDDPLVNQVASSNGWLSDPLVNQSGTRTEQALIDSGLLSREGIRRSFDSGLNTREIAQQESQRIGRPVSPAEVTRELSFGQKTKNDFRRLGTSVASTGRGLVEGAADIVAPFANAASYVGNALLPGQPFSMDVSGDASRYLTSIGVPEPTTHMGHIVRNTARLGTSMAGGGAMTGRVTSQLYPNMPAPSAPQPAIRPTGRETPAAQTLMSEGVPLDASQRSGGRFAQMLRSAVTDHPFTAGRQAEFAVTQQRAFNRAVLRSIGANADEATQDIMIASKERIGDVFNRIGSRGTIFDDALQSELATIVDDALREVPESARGPLLRNVDDLLAAVDENGIVNGQAFIRIRSRLSNLSRSPDVGQAAGRIEDALMGSLERAHPGQAEALQTAIDQWRNLRIIQSSIGHGAERNISPLRLSNAIATTRNQNMSVYGQGGDQRLVSIAQAGRSVIPEVLPNSGTNPRGLMSAPLRAIFSAPVYLGAQRALLPGRVQPGTGPLRPEFVGAGVGAYSTVSGN